MFHDIIRQGDYFVAYWIIKTEPKTYSFDQLLSEKKTSWDGVRNFQARNNLKTMKPGDMCFVYHSVGPRLIVGIAEVTSSHYPDKSAKEGSWVAVDVKARDALKNPVSLDQVKSNPRLSHIALVRQGRLSVAPLSKVDWDEIISMSKKAK